MILMTFRYQGSSLSNEEHKDKTLFFQTKLFRRVCLLTSLNWSSRRFWASTTLKGKSSVFSRKSTHQQMASLTGQVSIEREEIIFSSGRVLQLHAVGVRGERSSGKARRHDQICHSSSPVACRPQGRDHSAESPRRRKSDDSLERRPNVLLESERPKYRQIDASGNY